MDTSKTPITTTTTTCTTTTTTLLQIDQKSIYDNDYDDDDDDGQQTPPSTGSSARRQKLQLMHEQAGFAGATIAVDDIGITGAGAGNGNGNGPPSLPIGTGRRGGTATVSAATVEYVKYDGTRASTCGPSATAVFAAAIFRSLLLLQLLQSLLCCYWCWSTDNSCNCCWSTCHNYICCCYGNCFR